MQVFIGWGRDGDETSKALAMALRDWIPKVIQAVDPWLSQTDISAGSRWTKELAGSLESTKAGIFCVTQGAVQSRWMHFEAGAIAKTVEDSFVIPYLCGIKESELTGPLTHFQAIPANKAGTLKMLKAINAAGEKKLEATLLEESFEVRWQWLDDRLQEITRNAGSVAKEKPRDQRDLLEEILRTVRQIARAVPPQRLGALAAGLKGAPAFVPAGEVAALSAAQLAALCHYYPSLDGLLASLRQELHRPDPDVEILGEEEDKT